MQPRRRPPQARSNACAASTTCHRLGGLNPEIYILTVLILRHQGLGHQYINLRDTIQYTTASPDRKPHFQLWVRMEEIAAEVTKPQGRRWNLTVSEDLVPSLLLPAWLARTPALGPRSRKRHPAVCTAVLLPGSPALLHPDPRHSFCHLLGRQTHVTSPANTEYNAMDSTLAFSSHSELLLVFSVL